MLPLIQKYRVGTVLSKSGYTNMASLMTHFIMSKDIGDVLDFIKWLKELLWSGFVHVKNIFKRKGRA